MDITQSQFLIVCCFNFFNEYKSGKKQLPFQRCCRLSKFTILAFNFSSKTVKGIISDQNNCNHIYFADLTTHTKERVL